MRIYTQTHPPTHTHTHTHTHAHTHTQYYYHKMADSISLQLQFRPVLGPCTVNTSKKKGRLKKGGSGVFLLFLEGSFMRMYNKHYA